MPVVPKRFRRLIGLVAATVAVGAVIQELRIPSGQRTWHGRFFGVPYDFRPPTLERIRRAWWNPDDVSLFTPRAFGVGWSINLHRLLQKLTPPGG